MTHTRRGMTHTPCEAGPPGLARHPDQPHPQRRSAFP